MTYFLHRVAMAQTAAKYLLGMTNKATWYPALTRDQSWAERSIGSCLGRRVVDQEQLSKKRGQANAYDCSNAYCTDSYSVRCVLGQAWPARSRQGGMKERNEKW